jgi:hypothetical protein
VRTSSIFTETTDIYGVPEATCPGHREVAARLLANAELSGTVQLWEWIGDEAVTTFSY